MNFAGRFMVLRGLNSERHRVDAVPWQERVRSLEDLHGSSIAASSPGLDQGSEFTLPPALSEVRPERAAVVFKSGWPSEGRALCVPVVDDILDAAQSLAALLNFWGHEVCAAHDGVALEVAQARRPNVVLCDISLPGMDGYEVAHRLRAAPGSARPLVVALTGYALEVDRRRPMYLLNHEALWLRHRQLALAAPGKINRESSK
jgi:CheY-like chemotaxis protein